MGSAMQNVVRLLGVFLTCCVCCFVSAAAIGSEGPGASSNGSVPASILRSALTVPAVQALDGYQQVDDQVGADLRAPGAVAARSHSRTAFESLGSVAAARVTRTALPEVVARMSTGLGQMPHGAHVSRYSSANTAEIVLAGGRRGVVDSIAPVATRTSSGHYLPVDLGLRRFAGGFAAVNSAANVRFPSSLQSGVQLVSDGISLTPIDGAGRALRGTGQLDGSAVIYANTQTDADTAVKATPLGFESFDLLRSTRSPQTMAYRVGIPGGATLSRLGHGMGFAVILAGKAVGMIPAPTAVDAEGTTVPVSTTLTGRTLRLKIAHRSGDYRYPIAVDPTVVDSNLLEVTKNWRFESSGTHFKAEIKGSISEKYWNLTIDSAHLLNEWGVWLYPTQGESHIYALTTESLGAQSASNIQATVGMFNTAGWEAYTVMPTSFGKTVTTVCLASCTSSGGTAANLAAYWTTAIATGTSASYSLYSASVYIAQTNGPSVTPNTTSEKLGSWKNALYGSSNWMSAASSAVEFSMSDPGIGVHETEYIVPAEGKKWTASWACQVECPPSGKELITYKASGNGHLPDGEPTLEVKAANAMGGSFKTSVKVKVDGTAPYEVSLSGVPSGGQIAQGYHALKLTAKAKDGSGTTISSGIESLNLKLDGNQVGTPNGSCSPGPCTATAEWSINPEEYSTGSHILTVVATDKAGNVTTSSETPITIHQAASVPLGPGEVNPVSGEFDLEETDVSMPASGASLTLSRDYNSAQPGAGTTGPLGSPWSVSFGGAQKLEELENGSVVLTAADGSASVFTKSGLGRFDPPPNDRGMVLRYTGGESETFTLEDKGAKTTFTHVEHDSESIWRPTASTGAGGASSTTFSYQVVGSVIEPTEALGPVPSGVTCSPELKAGCRALTFAYAASTTATGEGPSGWGDYVGHLSHVYLTAYETVSKTMQTIGVAQYAYDTKGRLRAVWDPRVSPALKTTYGYDAEGHVTSLSPPGREPWMFAYGTTASDTKTGRLVAAGKPVAATALGSGIAPVNTKAPKLNLTHPVVGKAVSALSGVWSESPLRYNYQWERCTTSCSVIGGAINREYTPTESDVGKKLKVRVTAINSGGAVSATTVASSAVTTSPIFVTPTQLSTFGSAGSGNGQLSGPWGIAQDSSGNVWVADTNNYRIEEFNSEGSFVRTAGTSGSGTLSTPEDVATDSAGDAWVADTGNSRVVEFSPSGVYIQAFGIWGTGNGQFKYPLGITVDSSSHVWVVDAGNNRVQEFTTSGSFIRAFGSSGTGNGQFSSPGKVAPDSKGNLWVSDVGNNRIEEFTGEGVYIKQFGSAGSGNGQFCTPWRLTDDPVNDQLWVADSCNNRIQVFNTAGEFVGKFGSVGSGSGQFSSPEGVAFSSQGYAYILDRGNNRVSKWSGDEETAATAEETTPATMANTTLEYGIPASGAGAPYALSSSEVAKWGQTDLPVEGTAFFPPDEPMRWPATDYKRATIEYLDASDNVVNVATPTGGISTAEYNSYHDVVRTLSAYNQKAALNEGAKSVEVAQSRDTQSTYGSEGTELLSTLGPIHNVKLASGATAQARAHTVYSYDEGAPTGGPYRLVTKVTEGAQITGEPEADVRTTTISYAGQNNLGWVLRRPTATRTDPSGLKLTHSTIYDPTNGDITETRTPAAGPPGETILTGYRYNSTFSHEGSGEGQVTLPKGIAEDSHGNLWIADTGNNRIEEFSAGGTFILTSGTSGTGGGQFKSPQGIAIDSLDHVWVTDTGNNRIEEFSSSGSYMTTYSSFGSGAGQLNAPAGLVVSKEKIFIDDKGNNRIEEFTLLGQYVTVFGKSGTGNGEFKEPEGITADSSGNLWIADTGNSRIQELSSTGSFVQKWGTIGSGNGQLSKPGGLALDPEGNVLVADTGNNRMEGFSSSGTYLYQFGWLESEMKAPADLVVDPLGNAYVVDTGNYRAEKWVPASTIHESSGSGGTHGTQTIYYTAAANSLTPVCGEHAEWAGLPCETKLAAQPKTSGIPDLPVTVVTYNFWDEPLTATETVGTTTRTTTTTYDSAGRISTESISSTVGTSLPTVEAKYDSASGALTKLSTTVEGTTKTIEATFDKLGRTESYTDADGNTSTFTYDVDGRPESENDGKGTQKYTYNATSGFLTQLVDSNAGTFTATYDVEGNLATASYPNGMTATYIHNAAGQRTAVEYVKTTHCSTGCTWYSDSVVPSIHGQALSQTSTFSSQAYTYDAAGRLTQTQDTPAGSGCTTRIYAFDEETNITSLTTRSPGTGGVCATTGGTVENHAYDSANRLNDSGIAYSTFGDITKLSAVDAGGSELTSTFYTDGLLASQSQAGETIGYNLDPAGRSRQTISTGNTNSTVTSHYSGEGRSPAWTEDTAGKWVRDIHGIGGDLVATQASGETAVLQVENLHGDVVATASLSETATGLASSNDTTEYGVPRTSSPPKYSWLGGMQLSTELPSGIIAMGARSYIPRIGRFLQPDPVEGGSANAYAYTFGDPVNTADPSGEYTVGTPEWVHEFFDEEAVNATEEAIERAAEEQAAKEEAEQKAEEAREEAWAASAGPAAWEVELGWGSGGSKGKKSGKKAAKTSISHLDGQYVTLSWSASSLLKLIDKAIKKAINKLKHETDQKFREDVKEALEETAKERIEHHEQVQKEKEMEREVNEEWEECEEHWEQEIC